LRLIDFVYHSTLGLRVIKKKKTELDVPQISGGELLTFRVSPWCDRLSLQGYLAHKKTPTPLGPPKDPRGLR